MLRKADYMRIGGGWRYLPKLSGRGVGQGRAAATFAAR